MVASLGCWAGRDVLTALHPEHFQEQPALFRAIPFLSSSFLYVTIVLCGTQQMIPFSHTALPSLPDGLSVGSWPFYILPTWHWIPGSWSTTTQELKLGFSQNTVLWWWWIHLQPAPKKFLSAPSLPKWKEIKSLDKKFLVKEVFGFLLGFLLCISAEAYLLLVMTKHPESLWNLVSLLNTSF